MKTRVDAIEKGLVNLTMTDADPSTRPIVCPDDQMSNPPAARSIVRTIQLIAHPVNPVMPIILPIILPRIHPIIRALDDLFSLSTRRPSPTFHPIVRLIDDPTVLLLTRPIIHHIDDPFNLTVRRPSPTLSDPAICPINHPTDDPFIQSVGRPSPAIRLIIDPTDDPFIKSVGQPSLILPFNPMDLNPIITAPPWNLASNRISRNQFKSIVLTIIRLTIQVRLSQAEPLRPLMGCQVFPTPVAASIQLVHGIEHGDQGYTIGRSNGFR